MRTESKTLTVTVEHEGRTYKARFDEDPDVWIPVERDCRCGRGHDVGGPRRVVDCRIYVPPAMVARGRAICNPRDDYDALKGMRLALSRSSQGLAKPVRTALFAALHETWAQRGAGFLRLDIPCDPPVTQFYAPASVYAITPTTEEIARAAARSSAPTPVHRYELPPAPEDRRAESRRAAMEALVENLAHAGTPESFDKLQREAAALVGGAQGDCDDSADFTGDDEGPF